MKTLKSLMQIAAMIFFAGLLAACGESKNEEESKSETAKVVQSKNEDIEKVAIDYW